MPARASRGTPAMSRIGQPGRPGRCWRRTRPFAGPGPGPTVIVMRPGDRRQRRLRWRFAAARDDDARDPPIEVGQVDTRRRHRSPPRSAGPASGAARRAVAERKPGIVGPDQRRSAPSAHPRSAGRRSRASTGRPRGCPCRATATRTARRRCGPTDARPSGRPAAPPAPSHRAPSPCPPPRGRTAQWVGIQRRPDGDGLRREAARRAVEAGRIRRDQQQIEMGRAPGDRRARRHDERPAEAPQQTRPPAASREAGQRADRGPARPRAADRGRRAPTRLGRQANGQTGCSCIAGGRLLRTAATTTTSSPASVCRAMLRSSPRRAPAGSAPRSAGPSR